MASNSQKFVSDIEFVVNSKGVNSVVGDFTKLLASAKTLQTTLTRSGLEESAKQAGSAVTNLKNDLEHLQKLFLELENDMGSGGINPKVTSSDWLEVVSVLEKYKTQLMSLQKIAYPGFAEQQEADWNKILVLQDKLGKVTKSNQALPMFKQLNDELDKLAVNVVEDSTYLDTFSQKFSKLNAEITLFTSKSKEADKRRSQYSKLNDATATLDGSDYATKQTQEYKDAVVIIEKYKSEILGTNKALEDQSRVFAKVNQALKAVSTKEKEMTAETAKFVKNADKIDRISDKFKALDNSIKDDMFDAVLEDLERTKSSLDKMDDTDIAKYFDRMGKSLSKFTAISNKAIKDRLALPGQFDKESQALDALINKVDNFTSSLQRSIDSKSRWTSDSNIFSAKEQVTDLQKIQRALEETKAKMAITPRTTTEYKKLSQEINRLSMEYNKVHHAASKAKATLSEMDSGKWLKEISKRAMAYAGIYGSLYTIVDVAKRAAQYLVEFDQTVKTMSAVLDVTTGQARNLEMQLVQLGTAFGGTLEDINGAALSLGRAGIAFENVAGATEVVMKMAMLTGDTIETSANSIISYSQVFKDIPVEVLGDKLAYVANASRMSTQDINTFSNYALASAKSVGYSVDAINGMAIAFSNAGFNASTIGTQIRKFTTLLNDSSDDVTSFFRQMGVSQSVMRDMVANGEDTEALQMFLDKISKVDSTSFNQAISGMDLLVKNVLQALKTNALEVGQHMAKSISGVNGELEKAVLVSQSYTKVWEQMKNELGGIAVSSTNITDGMAQAFQNVALSIKTLWNYASLDKAEGDTAIVKQRLVNAYYELQEAQAYGSEAEVARIKESIKLDTDYLKILRQEMQVEHYLEQVARKRAEARVKGDGGFLSSLGNLALRAIPGAEALKALMVESEQTSLGFKDLNNGVVSANQAIEMLGTDSEKNIKILGEAVRLSGGGYKEFIETLKDAGDKGTQVAKILGITFPKALTDAEKALQKPAISDYTKEMEKATKDTVELIKSLNNLGALDANTFASLTNNISQSFSDAFKGLPESFHSAVSEYKIKVPKDFLDFSNVNSGNLAGIQSDIDAIGARLKDTNGLTDEQKKALGRLQGQLIEYRDALVKTKAANETFNQEMQKQRDEMNKIAETISRIKNEYDNYVKVLASSIALSQSSAKAQGLISNEYTNQSYAIKRLVAERNALNKSILEHEKLLNKAGAKDNKEKIREELNSLKAQQAEKTNQIKQAGLEQDAWIRSTLDAQLAVQEAYAGNELYVEQKKLQDLLNLKKEYGADDARLDEIIAGQRVVVKQKEQERSWAIEKQKLAQSDIDIEKEKLSYYGLTHEQKTQFYKAEISNIQKTIDIAKERQALLKQDTPQYQELQTQIEQLQLKILGLNREIEVSGSDSTAGAIAGVQKYLETVESTFQQTEKLALETANAAESAFSDVFFDAMQGNLKDAGDYWDAFAATVQRVLADMIAKMLVAQALQAALGMAGTPMANGGAFSGGTQVQADGGVWANGVQKFATGGIVTKPTYFGTRTGLGLMGEDGPEAILPLKRVNGKLGVETGQNVKEADQRTNIINMNVSAMDSKSFAQNLASNKNVIANVMRSAIGDNNPVRKAR